MPYKNNLQRYPSTIWRSVQNALNRMGIHPLVALGLIILLIISPRLVIFGAIIYAVYWLYRNGVFSNRGRNDTDPGARGRRGGGSGRGRRRR
jgi:hypothetical protein